ncbi:MAG: cytochrome c3 family protein [Armatimonadota bacterium]
MTKRVVRVLLVVGPLVVAATMCLAGDYHQGADLHCSDCHIMHASKDGATYGGGMPNPAGYSHLLKASSTNALCMTCHDGGDPTAPDIVATGSAAAPNDTLGIAYTSKYKNSAGFFQSDWSSVQSGLAHDLYASSTLTAIQGTWTSGASGMDCADCHDPHGTANYRNLVLRPGTAGADIDVRSGTEVYLRESITIPPTASDTATHYDTSAVAFDVPNNISTWCMGCHTNITNGEKHPVNVAVNGADGYTDADWVAGTGVGFGTDIDDDPAGTGTAGIPRIRFAHNGSDYATCSVANDANRLLCLTCHKAHGSKYDSATVWPHYITNAKDQTSACDQCHAKGA